MAEEVAERLSNLWVAYCEWMDYAGTPRLPKEVATKGEIRMLRFRIESLGENDAFVEVEATTNGLRLGVGYADAGRRALVTDVSPEQLAALSKALEAVVLVSDDANFDDDDDDE